MVVSSILDGCMDEAKKKKIKSSTPQPPDSRVKLVAEKKKRAIKPFCKIHNKTNFLSETVLTTYK